MVLDWIARGVSTTPEVPIRKRAIWMPSPVPSDPEAAQALQSEISVLLRRGVVERCDPSTLQACSPVFVIRKSSGGWRFIADLRRLNEHFAPRYCKLPTWAAIAAAVSPNAHACVLDVQAAFHNVPLARGLSTLMGFMYAGRAYCFRAAPFGYRNSPFLWSTLFRPALKHVTRMLPEARIVTYVDDLLVVCETAAEASRARDTVARELVSLGFRIKRDDRWEPRMVTRFLGFELDTRGRGTVRALPSRTGPLVPLCHAVVRCDATRQMAARLLGSIRALRVAWPWVLVDSALFAHWIGRVQAAWRQRVSPPDSVRRELVTLCAALRQRHEAPLRRAPPTVTITTDASGWGWGGHSSLGNVASGLFDPAERCLPACIREALGVIRAMQALRSDWEGRPLRIESDSTVVVASIQARRARSLSIVGPMRELRSMVGNGVIYASHIAGSLNVLADRLSRLRPVSDSHLLTESAIKEAMLALNCENGVDLFALGTNVFSINWAVYGVSLANPPFSLVARCVAHFRACAEMADNNFRTLLVTPRWASQSWFTAAGAMSSGHLDLEWTALRNRPPGDVRVWGVRVWRLDASLVQHL